MAALIDSPRFQAGGFHSTGKKGVLIRGLGVREVSQNRDTVRDDASAKFGAVVFFLVNYLLL